MAFERSIAKNQSIRKLVNALRRLNAIDDDIAESPISD